MHVAQFSTGLRMNNIYFNLKSIFIAQNCALAAETSHYTCWRHTTWVMLMLVCSHIQGDIPHSLLFRPCHELPQLEMKIEIKTRHKTIKISLNCYYLIFFLLNWKIKPITIALAYMSCLWHQQRWEKGKLQVVYAFCILLADGGTTHQPKHQIWPYLISASTWRPLITPDVKYYDKGLKLYL